MTASAGSPKILTGADRLAADGFAMLKGKRVGLVINHTARTGGRSLATLMAQSPAVSLAAILTPEHGLSGQAEAGAKVAGGHDLATGVPVHSLYGKTLKPTPEMMAGLDCLVFDMQDIGTRFYTFISTMGLCMQAAAQAKVPFIILDRPNPLGGTYVSGFLLEPAYASFVGRFEIPIAHGLTIAELARLAKGRRLLPGLEGLDLHIVEIENWRRDMLWPATGLAWHPTSPNIPTFETALAYPGMGLFEATVVNEGRGTRRPFLQVGHPATDGARLADRLSSVGLLGVSIESTRFVPRAIAGVATAPRFKGKTVSGIKITVTDQASYLPVETGIHCLAAFAADLAGAAVPLVSDAKAFDRLAGTRRLRDALSAGQSAAEIISSWQGEIGGYQQQRRPFLLYK